MTPLPRPITAVRVVRQLENWPEVVCLRLGLGRRELALLSFRNGISVAVRRRSRDWDVVRDLFLQSGYGRSFRYLQSLSEEATVIDLGANIGCFSLLAAAQNERLVVSAYEPGPPNIRVLELNRLANPALGRRIEVHAEAAAATTRTARWYFDEENAGRSSLYGSSGGTSVTARSFSEIVQAVKGPIALVKIDIEGAEYDLLNATPPGIWDRIDALSIELHDDPQGKETRSELLHRLSTLGFRGEPDGRFARFFTRSAAGDSAGPPRRAYVHG